MYLMFDINYLKKIPFFVKIILFSYVGASNTSMPIESSVTLDLTKANHEDRDVIDIREVHLLAYLFCLSDCRKSALDGQIKPKAFPKTGEYLFKPILRSKLKELLSFVEDEPKKCVNKMHNFIRDLYKVKSSANSPDDVECMPYYQISFLDLAARLLLYNQYQDKREMKEIDYLLQEVDSLCQSICKDLEHMLIYKNANKDYLCCNSYRDDVLKKMYRLFCPDYQLIRPSNPNGFKEKSGFIDPDRKLWNKIFEDRLLKGRILSHLWKYNRLPRSSQ